MKSYIHHIEPVLPQYSYRQDYARDRMVGWMPGKRNRRLIKGIYNHSGIETRYSVLPDFGPTDDSLLFREDEEGRMIEPSTQQRNRYYAECSRKLVVEAGRKALQNVHGISKEDITHVITVSCTGFYNPGPDFDLIQGLELSDSTERYNLGFMGCYAAFPALRMADQFCQARPDAVVLVVGLELCSLHLQFNEEADSLLANSLFADGAVATLVSARKPAPDRPALALHSFSSALAPEGATDMAWEVGDRGFDIRLSSYVPRIIAENINGIMEGVMKSSAWNLEDIRTWAVHPGGRSILDKVATGLELDEEMLTDSREVLREYGNMSSVTVLFVLHRILNRSDIDEPHPVCAMAFGPGLTIETGLLEVIPATAPVHKKEPVRHAEVLTA